MNCPICNQFINNDGSWVNFCPSCQAEAPRAEFFYSVDSYVAWTKKNNVEKYVPAVAPVANTAASMASSATGSVTAPVVAAAVVSQVPVVPPPSFPEPNVPLQKNEESEYADAYSLYCNNQYHLATISVESALRTYPDSARLLFLHLLCKYRIEYHEDPVSGKDGVCIFKQKDAPSLFSDSDFDKIRSLNTEESATCIEKITYIEIQRVKKANELKEQAVASNVAPPPVIPSTPAPVTTRAVATPPPVYNQAEYNAMMGYNTGNVYKNNGLSESYTDMTSTANSHSDKSKFLTLLLAIFTGYVGGHRYYAGKYKSAVLYTFTLGGFYFGWLIDILLIVVNKFTDGNGKTIDR